jgi:Secretion system C-terminal sorting domain
MRLSRGISMTLQTLIRMRNLFIFCYFILWQQVAYAQMFKTMFVVEDAVGNRDSVWLGFDTLASYYNPQFGEAHIDAPFDSILEVRCTHFVNSPIGPSVSALQSKTIIGACELYGNINCYNVEYIIMYIQAKYTPVTISWDRSYIYNYSPCQTSAFLTPDRNDGLVGTQIFYYHYQTYGDQVRIACISETDSYVFDPTPANRPSFELPYNLSPTETGNQDSIFGLSIHLSDGSIVTPCSWLNSTKGAGTPGFEVTVSPNPAWADLVISCETEQLLSVDLYSSMGQLIRSIKGEGTHQFQMDLSGLPVGMYVAIVTGRDRRQRVIKIIKT